MPDPSRTIRIAIVQSSCGHLTCVGPDDFKKTEFNDAMDAATSWLIEAGWMPSSRYWVAAEIPAPLADVPEIAGTMEAPDAT